MAELDRPPHPPGIAERIALWCANDPRDALTLLDHRCFDIDASPVFSPSSEPLAYGRSRFRNELGVTAQVAMYTRTIPAGSASPRPCSRDVANLTRYRAFRLFERAKPGCETHKRAGRARGYIEEADRFVCWFAIVVRSARDRDKIPKPSRSAVCVPAWRRSAAAAGGIHPCNGSDPAWTGRDPSYPHWEGRSVLLVSVTLPGVDHSSPLVEHGE